MVTDGFTLTLSPTFIVLPVMKDVDLTKETSQIACKSFIKSSK